MTATEKGLIKMMMALCILLDVSPYDLARIYLDTDECQKVYAEFLRIAT